MDLSYLPSGVYWVKILDEEGRYGLGAYLYEALGKEVPIIGVAKKHFKTNGKQVREVYRGQSQKPLYVTSIGLPLAEASQNIVEMHGAYRIPDLLKILDRHTKTS